MRRLNTSRAFLRTPRTLLNCQILVLIGYVHSCYDRNIFLSNLFGVWKDRLMIRTRPDRTTRLQYVPSKKLWIKPRNNFIVILVIPAETLSVALDTNTFYFNFCSSFENCLPFYWKQPFLKSVSPFVIGHEFFSWKSESAHEHICKASLTYRLANKLVMNYLYWRTDLLWKRFTVLEIFLIRKVAYGTCYVT